MLNCTQNRNDVKGAEYIWGGGLEFLKGKTPRQKNATHQRVNFSHPHHHPREIQGNYTRGVYPGHQRNLLHKHNIKTPKIHGGGIHCQRRGDNTTRIYKKSQTVLHVVGIQGNKHPCGQAINLHQR